jgi:hypothetical protein
MTNLNPGTLYYVRAYASNSGSTGYGSQVSFTTAPAAPTGVAAATIGGPAGSGELSVSWSACAGALTYNVYASIGSTRPTSPTTGGIDVTATSCTLSGLTNYATYNVWVVATGAGGTSADSSPASGYVGVKVTGIMLNKSSATLLPGSKETLTVVTYTTYPSSLTPSESTAIAWSTSNSSNVSVSSGLLTGASAGASTATITATCTAYSQSATCVATVIAYLAGATGPAGGVLFYDGGSSSYSTNGWRYMEAVPYSKCLSNIAYGNIATYYRQDGDINKPVMTFTAVGTGKENTSYMISVFNLFSSYFSGQVLGVRETANTSYNGYTDWFLPSKDEVTALVALNDLQDSNGGYWSSSLVDTNNVNFYQKSSSSWINQSEGGFSSHYLFRPVRRF